MWPSRMKAMLLRTYTPLLPLSPFVDCFWYLEGYNPAHSRELTLPDGSADAIINLTGRPIRLFDRHNRALVFGHSVLCGPHTDFFIIDTAGEGNVIGIHFKPGGLHPFVEGPLHPFLNQHVSLCDLWGAKADELVEALQEAEGPDAMFHVLEKTLRALAFKPFARNQAVQYALSHLQHAQVADIMDRVGFSHRRFNELFKDEIGMAPKRLSRLYRFQTALELMGKSANVIWQDIVFACGYYDQAHFIKDFQSFSGINPSQYDTIPGRHRNHVSL